MELRTLGSPDKQRRWQDPSASIFREQSLSRPRKSQSTPLGSRSNQTLADNSPCTSRNSALGAGSSSAIFRRSSISKEKMGCCKSCCECLGRIPYGSLLATIITGAGIGVWCTCSSIGLPHLAAMLRSFKMTIRPGVEDACMTAIISIGAVMAALAVVLLIIGFLATGATRKQVYTGSWSRITGRIAAGFFIILTYFLTIFWFIICCALLVVSTFFVVSVTNCQAYNQTQSWEGNCFNVSTIVEGIPANINLDQLQTRVCSDDFKAYCDEATQGHLLFYAANGGVALIVLGLIHFLMCLSANYAHIKDGLKLRHYEEAKYSDGRDYASF